MKLSHRLRRTSTYRSWEKMKYRCKTDPRYTRKGVTVHAPWASFEVFLRDMGEAPEGTTIDRIDNEGPYAPGNCRWATPAEQNRNTCRNLWLTHEGESLVLMDWSLRTGIPYPTLRTRYHRQGDNPASWVLRPVQRRPHAEG